MRTSLVFLMAFLAVLSLSLGGCHLLFQAPAPAPVVTPSTTFDAARLLVLADADMAATAYADGILYPIADQDDAVFMLDRSELATASAGGTLTDAIRRVPASNSVMGWPGAAAVSRDGAYAYVVENRQPVSREVERFDEGVFAEVPVGRTLTTIALDAMAAQSGVDAASAVVSRINVCTEPLSIDVAPSGAWLLAACGDGANELTVVPLREGLPDAPRQFDLDVPTYGQRAVDAGATYAVVHPDGAAAGVVLENRAVALVRFQLDEAGVPVAAEAEPPTETDRWMSVARWTPTGRHLLVADVGWGPAPTDAVFNRPGSVAAFALAPGDEQRGVASEARVSFSPEAIELDRSGTLLVAVNMERTYLPGGWMRLIPRRGSSSLSLVAVDPETGALDTLGEPVGFRGVLPEDAVFDADGDQVAVVVYQDHDAPRSDGWVEFFEVDRSGSQPRLLRTGHRVTLPRGTHDLVVIDQRRDSSSSSE